MDLNIILKLMHCFPGSKINQFGEFIAHEKANEYFSLNDCVEELDLQCKVLEWFSRGAYKTEPYRNRKKNEDFHRFMLNGINEFLGTSFTHEDMELIYCELGNGICRTLTIEFIESGFDLNLLKTR